MLLGEPARTSFDLSFSISNIPVRIHPLFWVVALIMAGGGGDTSPQSVLAWIAVVFFSILIHELGHAIAIRYYGWSPSIILYGLGGLATYNPGYTSFSSHGRRGNSTQAQIIISAAGPAAGFVFACFVIAGLHLSGHSIRVGFTSGFYPEFGSGTRIPLLVANHVNLAHTLISSLLFVNIGWGIVNLFPVYPLDGGKIARELCLSASPSDGIRQSLILSIVAGIVVALVAYSQWDARFLALLFGYLAYSNYVTLQGQFGPGNFGGGFGSGRPW